MCRQPVRCRRITHAHTHTTDTTHTHYWKGRRSQQHVKLTINFVLSIDSSQMILSRMSQDIRILTLAFRRLPLSFSPLDFAGFSGLVWGVGVGEAVGAELAPSASTLVAVVSSAAAALLSPRSKDLAFLSARAAFLAARAACSCTFFSFTFGLLPDRLPPFPPTCLGGDDMVGGLELTTTA